MNGSLLGIVSLSRAGRGRNGRRSRSEIMSRRVIGDSFIMLVCEYGGAGSYAVAGVGAEDWDVQNSAAGAGVVWEILVEGSWVRRDDGRFMSFVYRGYRWR